MHHLATAPHLRLVGLGPTGLMILVHAEVARLGVGLEQRQPLRLRLLLHLLARQRRRCRPLRRRPPLRRPRDAQRRLLGGGEATQVHHRATAPHLRLVGVGLAGLVVVHAEVARLVIGLEQRQPLRLGLRPPHRRPPTRRHGRRKWRTPWPAATSETANRAPGEEPRPRYNDSKGVGTLRGTLYTTQSIAYSQHTATPNPSHLGEPRELAVELRALQLALESAPDHVTVLGLLGGRAGLGLRYPFFG